VKYQQVMSVLSQSGLGAVVISSDSTILSVNTTGERLLCRDSSLGEKLSELAPELCTHSPLPLYANPAFGTYLLRAPSPDVQDLPPDTQLVVFRDATNDACHDMLIQTLNKMTQSVVLCDANSRMYLLNDAAVDLDSMVTRDVLGERLQDCYVMLDGEEMSIPQVIRTKKAKINHRQHYATRYGKEVHSISSTYPIVQNGQVLAGLNILEHWGAIDDLHKQIIDLQEKLLEQSRENAGKRSALSAKYTFRDIIHTSAQMHNVLMKCRQVAKTDSSVMFYGETGTGKELFAQSIHNASQRANGPFLAINCAALPETLLESLLFGTERGAYTGAERRAGLFEQANHGTLLLDELNSMDISLQAKLLRVLQDGVIRRVGGSSEIRVDVRVLSNINIPPQQAIAEGKLRRDLFYRLGVVNINIPPLRERKEDISLLAKHFIMRYNKLMNKTTRNIDTQTLEKFRAYDWPGNVRELQHAVEHAMNLLPDDLSMISPEYIPEHISQPRELLPRSAIHLSQPAAPILPPERPLNNRIHDMEYESICDALRQSRGNISEAARMLHLSRQNLQYRIKKYKIDINSL